MVLADIFGAQAAKNAGDIIQNQPDVAGSVGKGLMLAQHIEQVQQKRQELEQAKEQHQLGKAEKIMDAIQKGHNFKDKAAQDLYFKNHLPGMIKAYKMEDLFPPETFEYIAKSPEIRQKLIGLQLDIQDKINSGELKGGAILEYAKSKLTDPAELAMLDTDALVEQQKFAASEEGKALRAKSLAEATSGQRGIGNLAEMRKEVSNHETTKKTSAIASAYDKIRQTIGGKPSAAGDMAGIFSYMKMLDPTSTVREGEYASAKNAGGIPDKIQSAYNNALKGELLSPEQRKDFINQSEKIYRSAYEEQMRLYDNYRENARAAGVNPELILVTKFKAPPPLKGKAPPAKQSAPEAPKKAAPNAASSNESFYDVAGVKLTKEQARAYYEAHPERSSDLDAKTRKELGF